jgi:hypothetical protein
VASPTGRKAGFLACLPHINNQGLTKGVNVQKEIWKVIPCAPDYEVSNLGSVRRRPMRPWLTSKGYKRIKLRVDGVYRPFFVHRLVMETFLGSSALEVNHKSGDKQDNSLENLEYVTGAENIRHAATVLNRAGGRPRKTG